MALIKIIIFLIKECAAEITPSTVSAIHQVKQGSL